MSAIVKFYATPLNTSVNGFFFTNEDEFDAGMELLKEKNVEKVEIEIIEVNDSTVYTLFSAVSFTQSNVVDYINLVDDIIGLDEREMKLKDAMDRYTNVCIFSGSLSEYAEEYYEEACGDVLAALPAELRYSINYASIGHDMEAEGEVVEIGHNLLVTNPYDF